MIGLEHEKFKSSLASRMKDYGILLDSDQPETGLRFQGMGNKRKATIEIPDDLSDDNFDAKVNEAADMVRQKLTGGIS